MLRQIYQSILHHLLHPPLSPNNSSDESTPLLLRYLPLLVLLTLFWPIFATLLAASFSASAWLFWLCIGATTGLVQLLYVLYNFFMIIWDLAIIVILKTFSMIRSKSRRAYYKAVFATYKSMGIEPSSRKSNKNSNGSSKHPAEQRRRRKEWSQDVGRATNYKEFEEIEIYEPIITNNTHGGNGGSDGKTTVVLKKRRKKKRLNSVLAKRPGAIQKSVSVAAAMNSSDDGGDDDDDDDDDGVTTASGTVTPPSSPIATIEESPAADQQVQQKGESGSSSSQMRKTHSCLEFKRQTTSKTNNLSKQKKPSMIRRSSTLSSSNGKPWISPIKRTYSSSSLPHGSNQNSEHDSSVDDDDMEERWQNIVKDDLGMEGSMLLTTLARLKEARVQAASQGSDQNDHGNNNQDEEEDDDDDGLILPTLSSLSKDEEDETTNSNNTNQPNIRESSYHITASFTSTSTSPKQEHKKKKWNEDYSASLKTLLSGIVKRNHLSIEDWLIQDGRSVAERGQHSLRKETRDAIDRYGEEVERCMDWIANGPVYLGPTSGGNDDDNNLDDGEEEENDRVEEKNSPEDVMEKQREELSKRYTLVKRMKQNVGHTALMLSGGGAQTMYHLGSIKALVEAGIYEHIHVISGTSGGSISAAMCAIKTPAELLTDICVRDVATDYMRTGEQREKNVRWFPSAFEMGKNYIKKGIVVDGDEFKRCCDFYYKDITFEEAYQMTRKHVCITVTASRASSGRGMQRLLLNHISTPNVTLASAVRASCAVPGVFKAATLMIKDSRGKEVPFEVDGVEWIDGSVQADIPTKRISTLFNVSNYVVCQTNFHVVPFIHKSHHPSLNSLYWKLFQFCMNDAGNRLGALSQFGLLPKFAGNDLSKMFKQTYYGHLTLVPKFTTRHKLGLSILTNPSEEEMDVYLQGGQEAAWPFIRSIQEMLHLERSIDKCLTRLGERLRSVTSGLDLNLSNDDVDSVSSVVGAAYRARLPGLGREAELLRERVQDLEQENEQLKRKVQRLQRALGISHPKSTLGPLDIISVDENEVHEET